MENVTVQPFQTRHEREVIDLILGIQQKEFGVPITLDQQPDLKMIPEFYRQGNGNFWVALCGGQVVGTIALIDIGNAQFALRKMFVDQKFRGGNYRTGQLLLETAERWMKEKEYSEVFLGTLDVFQAAQRFYRRNGFTEVQKSGLPANFPPMKLDNIFFKKEIRARNAVTIVPYDSCHQPWFEKLNREWIEKYFWMEPIDFDVLQHPEKHIVDHGGSILMARYNGEVAGTVALKYASPGTYEFTKMAVDERFRGKKIGQALAEAAIAEAKSKGAQKIILYSNTALAPAIALYRKIGFRDVPLDGPYQRSNIKMELNLIP